MSATTNVSAGEGQRITGTASTTGLVSDAGGQTSTIGFAFCHGQDGENPVPFHGLGSAYPHTIPFGSIGSVSAGGSMAAPADGEYLVGLCAWQGTGASFVPYVVQFNMVSGFVMVTDEPMDP